MSLVIAPYTPDLQKKWDVFVQESRNGTFLHSRAYMDYHSDRFKDQSVIVKSNDNIVGVFPANEANDTISSHDGLTFGGLVFGMSQRASQIQEMLSELAEYYSKMGFKKILYKSVPHLFHKYPAEDDLFWLYRNEDRN